MTGKALLSQFHDSIFNAVKLFSQTDHTLWRRVYMFLQAHYKYTQQPWSLTFFPIKKDRSQRNRLRFLHITD